MVEACGTDFRGSGCFFWCSLSNTTAIASYNADNDADVAIRQVKYLNNIVEQDHRVIKCMVRPMFGFKAFWSAVVTIAGIEIMHMIRTGQ